MMQENGKKLISFAMAGAFVLAMAGTAAAAPLPVANVAGGTNQAKVELAAYRHHYRGHRHYAYRHRHYRYYRRYYPGAAAGAVAAGAALGIIGGAAAAASGYPYYGYPYYGYPYYRPYYYGYYGPGYYGW